MAVARMKWAAGVFAVGGLLAVGTWGAGQVPGGPPPGKSTPPGMTEAPAEKAAGGERVADAAQRQRSLKNLQTILLAIHAYHDVHKQLPADVTDKAGKPLLSWRVELLPFLNEDNLYKQLKRDEPWDSPHNLRLLAKMPDVYRVAFDPTDATHTYYQRFAITGVGWPIVLEGMTDGGAGSSPAAGPPMGGSPPSGAGAPMGPPGVSSAPGSSATPPPGGSTAGPPMGTGGMPPAPPANVARFPLQFAEVTDGTSNTLGVVEAGPPVPWSKPADLAYDARKPLPPMAGPYTNVRHAAMLDGAAYALRPKLDETTWRRLIEPSDGNVLPEWDILKARFPADSAEEKKALGKLLTENEALIAAVEEQLREHAALLRLTTTDTERAAEQADELKRLLEVWKAKNRKLRDELGLRPGAAVPKP
jgi:hypothetical protein